MPIRISLLRHLMYYDGPSHRVAEAAIKISMVWFLGCSSLLGVREQRRVSRLVV